MSHFGLKINKSESPDKTPYTVYYPHSIQSTERRWVQPYYQVISIDPARKNYGFRIERRYHNGWITPIVFDKTAVESFEQEGDTIICNTYQVLTSFLTKYEQFYDDCHFIIIERQLPQNYKASRIAQHTISYFSIRTHNKPLLPSIIEIDPKLKGKILGAPKGITDKQLKTWAVEKARELLSIRKDDFSLQVLNHFRNKQDDLSDTVCQAEALFICWGLQPTCPPPSSIPDDSPISCIEPITLSLTPSIVISNIDDIASMIHPINTRSFNQLVSVPSSKDSTNKIQLQDTTQCIHSGSDNILSFVQNPPIRNPVSPISLNCVTPNIPALPGIHNLLHTNSISTTNPYKLQSDGTFKQTPITLTILK